MTDSKFALYRLEYRSDVTAADTLTINLGYMLEAAAADGFRFLGLASRKSLTPLELDNVNVQTWPELLDLDAFMDGLFEQGWSHVCEAAPDDLRMGCNFLAHRYSAQSALHFGRLDDPAFGAGDLSDTAGLHRCLYDRLLNLGDNLRPELIAPVIPLKRRQPAPAPVAFPKFRSEADYGAVAA